MASSAEKRVDNGLVQSVLDFMTEAAVVVDSQGELVLFNRAAEDLFGPPQAVSGLRNWEARCGLHPGDTPDRPCRPKDLPWNRILRGYTVEDAIFFLRNERHPAGVWLNVNGKAERDSANRVIQATIALRDISVRWRAKEALNISERMNHILFEENQVAVIHTTPEGRIQSCNHSFARMLGYDSPDALCEMQVADLQPPGVRSGYLRRLMQMGALKDEEIQFIRRDGSRGFAVANMRAIESDSGESDFTIIATVVDISEHRQLELARLQAETRFTAFMRHFPGIAFIKDATGRYIFLSESSLKAFGKRADEVIGKSDYEIWPPEFAEQWHENDHEVLTHGKAIRVSEDTPVGDAVHRWTFYKFPIPNTEGEPMLIGGIGVDENDRLMLEARLQQAEKMEAIGRLAGGVAHDFNNLLTVISGYGQMLQDAIAREVPADKLQSYLTELLGAGQRAVALTDQLLSFSRRKPVRPERIDLRANVNEVERMLRRLIGEHIELKVDASAAPCYIRADSGQMEQILMNLAANARDAMPKGGRLTIRVAPAAEVPIGLSGKDFVLLEVRDTGIGMDEKTYSRMFEPFFTCKPKGKGVGLGLSMVYGIVKQSGGEIAVHSEPNAGTVFQIFFPESPSGDPPPPPDAATRLEARQALMGDEVILLVEDDDAVRNLVKAMLERYGYKPLVATGAAEAVEIFSERAAEIKMLLTDVIMPQTSGGELAVNLRLAHPELKVLYMSGYTAGEIATQGHAGINDELLRKPFNAETLARRVREVLDTSARLH